MASSDAAIRANPEHRLAAHAGKRSPRDEEERHGSWNLAGCITSPRSPVDAPGTSDFYTDTLGLRLVKTTVNQDDVSAYHLFYGDEAGSPAPR